jgi:hypothetical protein
VLHFTEEWNGMDERKKEKKCKIIVYTRKKAVDAEYLGIIISISTFSLVVIIRIYSPFIHHRYALIIVCTFCKFQHDDDDDGSGGGRIHENSNFSLFFFTLLFIFCC